MHHSNWLCIFSALFYPFVTHGASFDNQLSDNNWHASINWANDLLPRDSGGETARIIGANTAYVTRNLESSDNSYHLVVGNAASGGQLFVAGDMPDLAGVFIAYRPVTNLTSANGHVVHTQGDIRASFLQIGGSSGGSASYSISGGSVNFSSSMAVYDTARISVSGSDALINASSLDLFDSAELLFKLDANGVGSIDLSSGELSIDESNPVTGNENDPITTNPSIILEGQAYTGGSSTIELIKFGSRNGSFEEANISFSGFSGRYSASIVQNEDSINLVIVEAETTLQAFNNNTGNNLWGTPQNWDLEVIPTGHSDVALNSNVIIKQPSTADKLTINQGYSLSLESHLEVNTLTLGNHTAGLLNQINSNLTSYKGVFIASSQNSTIDESVYRLSGGSLAFSGGSLDIGTSGKGSFIIDGSLSDYISGNSLQLGDGGTLHYILDAAGAKEIRLSNQFALSQKGSIIVDGTHYKGSDNYFPLIRGGIISGEFNPSMVSFVGFDDREPELVLDDGLWVRLLPKTTHHDRLGGLFLETEAHTNYNNSTFNTDSKLNVSGSLWSQKFHEAHVMDSLLSSNHSDSDLSWDLRIGRAGQIYSFRSDNIGEIVPPQSFDNSPWIDSVWQGVATSQRIERTVPSHIAHQSGIYIPEGFNEEPYFSPLLDRHINQAERSFSSSTLASIAAAGQYLNDSTDDDHQSEGIFYNKYKDLGNGVIEVSLGLYNFGENELSFHNLPFGGIRTTSLPYAFLGNLSDSYDAIDLNLSNRFFMDDIGGWIAYSDSAEGDSTTLGVAFGYGNSPDGTSQNARANIRSQYYTASPPVVDETGWRNGHIFTCIRQFDLPQGAGVWARYYFVLGKNVDDVEAKIANLDLVSLATLEPFSYTEEDTPLIGYSVSGSGATFQINETIADANFYLYAYPVSGSFPLFELTTSSLVTKITSDPYATGALAAFDGEIKGLKLLGYAMNDSSLESSSGYQAIENVLGESLENYAQTNGRSLMIRSIESRLEEWRVNHFGYINEVGQAANTADPENDGITNLEEYAFGGDPLSTTNELIRPVLEKGENQNSIFYTFLERINGGLNYEIEKSATLEENSWTNVPYLADEATGASLFRLNAVEIPISPLEPKSFYRLRISEVAKP